MSPALAGAGRRARRGSGSGTGEPLEETDRPVHRVPRHQLLLRFHPESDLLSGCAQGRLCPRAQLLRLPHGVGLVSDRRASAFHHRPPVPVLRAGHSGSRRGLRRAVPVRMALPVRLVPGHRLQAQAAEVLRSELAQAHEVRSARRRVRADRLVDLRALVLQDLPCGNA